MKSKYVAHEMMLAKKPADGQDGNALLVEVTHASAVFSECNAVACLKAQQEVQLGNLQAALSTLEPFLGSSDQVTPSHWALHLATKIAWMTGEVSQVKQHHSRSMLLQCTVCCTLTEVVILYRVISA